MPEATVRCSRCGQEEPALARAPMPGKLGQEILDRVGAPCWAEWRKSEVMVINELRLNFMEPSAQEILTSHLRDFLQLGSASG